MSSLAPSMQQRTMTERYRAGNRAISSSITDRNSSCSMASDALGSIGRIDSVEWLGSSTVRNGNRPCAASDSHADAVQPASQRILHSHRRGLASQDQKRRLESVIRVVIVTQDPPADPLHHPAMSRDERGKGRLGYVVVVLGGELRQQLKVAQGTGCAEAEQHRKVGVARASSWHRT